MTMKCEEFRDLLDNYIDGALSKEQIDAMDGHALLCAECARELKAAMLLKKMFTDTTDSVELPEEARVLLYERVRAAKQKNKRDMYIRIFSAAAAALVLFIGISAAFKPGNKSVETAGVESIAEYDFVASDGEAVSDETADLEIAPAAELAAVNNKAADAAVFEAPARTVVKLKSNDSGAAMSAVETLASQYEGSASVSAEDNTITAVIPSDQVDEFIDDLGFAGEVETDEIEETEEEMVELDIIIEQE